jgi:hypothetical protein
MWDGKCSPQRACDQEKSPCAALLIVEHGAMCVWTVVPVVRTTVGGSFVPQALNSRTRTVVRDIGSARSLSRLLWSLARHLKSTIIKTELAQQSLRFDLRDAACMTMR